MKKAHGHSKAYSSIFDAAYGPSWPNPKGGALFTPGCRCERLVMMGITVPSTPNPAKKWLPQNG